MASGKDIKSAWFQDGSQSMLTLYLGAPTFWDRDTDTDLLFKTWYEGTSSTPVEQSSTLQWNLVAAISQSATLQWNMLAWPWVTSVDLDDTVASGQLNVKIYGGHFGSAGTVDIYDAAGNDVFQTGLTWTDTEITVAVLDTGGMDGAATLRVRRTAS